MTFRALGLVGLTLALALPASAQTADYSAAIDAERLTGADTENESWLSYGRTYDEQRYSPLNQINHDTVKVGTELVRGHDNQSWSGSYTDCS